MSGPVQRRARCGHSVCLAATARGSLSLVLSLGSLPQAWKLRSGLSGAILVSKSSIKAIDAEWGELFSFLPVLGLEIKSHT